MSLPTPDITLTGNIRSIFNGEPTGREAIVITLVNYGRNLPTVSGTLGFVDLVQTITPSAVDGSFSQTFFSNLVISPGPNITYYQFDFVNGNGETALTVPFQFTAAGSFNLAALTPFGGPFLQPPFGNAIIANPNALQTIATFQLDVPSLGVKGSSTFYTNIVSNATATRTFTLPDANSNPVQPATASTHQFATGVSASGVISFAQPAAADLSDGTTGSGNVTLNTSPTLVTPVLGVASATSINKLAITAPATGSTLTIANGKTLTANNTLTFAGTDATTLTFQGTGTVVNRDSTDTLTGKTISTSGTGNHIQIAGNDLPTSIGSSGQSLTNNGGTLAFVSRGAGVTINIDGGGSTPLTGVRARWSAPVACTVTGWVLIADVSGSAVIDVLRSTYSGFPTTSSIAGTDKPTLSSVQKNENLGPLSGWTSTAIAAGDVLEFNLSSVATVTELSLSLNVTVP